MNNSGYSDFILYSQGTKRSRFRLLGGNTVDIIPPHNLKICEPGCLSTCSCSASSRAPAIQPAQRSRLLRALAGRGFWTGISAVCDRPPGFKTRNISPKTRPFYGERLIAPFDMISSPTWWGQEFPCGNLR
jgi:hypothetical protein